MNKCFFIALILLLLSLILFSCADNPPEQLGAAAFDSLSGPYLGQTPSETEPEMPICSFLP